MQHSVIHLSQHAVHYTPWLINFVTGSVCLWSPSTHFTAPSPSPFSVGLGLKYARSIKWDEWSKTQAWTGQKAGVSHVIEDKGMAGISVVCMVFFFSSVLGREDRVASCLRLVFWEIVFNRRTPQLSSECQAVPAIPSPRNVSFQMSGGLPVSFLLLDM